MLNESTTPESIYDDPRKLSGLLSHVCSLAQLHAVPSLVAGLAAPSGDRRFPDFIDFLQGALRVEDRVFRMTRERVVIHLADVDEAQGKDVLERLLGDFIQRFPATRDPVFETRFFEVKPGTEELRVKDVLITLF